MATPIVEAVHLTILATPPGPLTGLAQAFSVTLLLHGKPVAASYQGLTGAAQPGPAPAGTSAVFASDLGLPRAADAATISLGPGPDQRFTIVTDHGAHTVTVPPGSHTLSLLPPPSGAPTWVKAGGVIAAFGLGYLLIGGVK